MISNDRRQRTLQDTIVELSRHLIDGDVEALRAHLDSTPVAIESATMVDCLVVAGQMLVEQFSFLLGTTSSRSEALRLLPTVMDTAADNMMLGAAVRRELAAATGAVGVAAALVECVQFGTADDIDDLLDAARGEFADLDVLFAVAGFSAALTGQIANAYSLPTTDVHEQFFGPADAVRPTMARPCRHVPRVAATVPVPAVPAVRSNCAVASSRVA